MSECLNPPEGDVSFPTLSPSRLPEMAHLPAWQNTDHYNRGFEEYCDSLGLNLRTFQDQRILDIGAGRTALFAKEAKANGINNVTSLNPNWSLAECRDKPIYGQAVAGTVEELPFADSSFDFVVSFWGVPAYLPGTEKAYFDTFHSIKRVLRPNGWGLLVPIPAMTVQQPEFYNILDSVFPGGGYEFVGTRYFPMPKLLLYKDISDDKRTEIETYKPSIAAATFPIW